MLACSGLTVLTALDDSVDALHFLFAYATFLRPWGRKIGRPNQQMASAREGGEGKVGAAFSERTIRRR
jgi:hypothetical protein